MTPITWERTARATVSARATLMAGFTTVRDLGTEGAGYADVGLKHVETILGVRERYRDLVDIQLVAFPQSGILRSPGTAELLDQALAGGADVLGGLDPSAIDRDPATFRKLKRVVLMGGSIHRGYDDLVGKLQRAGAQIERVEL